MRDLVLDGPIPLIHFDVVLRLLQLDMGTQRPPIRSALDTMCAAIILAQFFGTERDRGTPLECLP